MATLIDPGDEVFLDASYAIALAAPGDIDHHRAVRLADEVASAKARFVTTRAVLLEIGNALSKQRHRRAAVEHLQDLEADPTVEVVGLSDDLFARAVELFAARADKDWGLIDWVSFVVMEDYGLEKALTADVHFQQAGFRALLRETDD